MLSFCNSVANQRDKMRYNYFKKHNIFYLTFCIHANMLCYQYSNPCSTFKTVKNGNALIPSFFRKENQQVTNKYITIFFITSYSKRVIILIEDYMVFMFVDKVSEMLKHVFHTVSI